MNKQYFFIVQGDGNAVVYRGSGPSDNHGAMWASGTNGKNNITLNFNDEIINEELLNESVLISQLKDNNVDS